MNAVARRFMAEAYAGITPAEALLVDTGDRRSSRRRKVAVRRVRPSTPERVRP